MKRTKYNNIFINCPYKIVNPFALDRISLGFDIEKLRESNGKNDLGYTIGITVLEINHKLKQYDCNLPKVAGLYFLFLQNKLSYIGVSSVDISKRLIAHIKHTVVFDQFSYILKNKLINILERKDLISNDFIWDSNMAENQRRFLHQQESFLIKHFHPLYNNYYSKMTK